jgi:predicted amidohydrolase
MTLRVAIVQRAPVYGDAEASMKLFERSVEEAQRAGARLVVVGETWLPGYPAWIDHCPSAAIWDQPDVKDLYARLRRESVVVGGALCDRLADAARTHGVVLVIGIQERVDEGPGSGTLYNSALIFDADGRLLNHHRKLVPTFSEKLLWGYGDAAGLRAVKTAVGRVGALICWEHWMPLARQALHDSGELIHVALWPWVHEKHQVASRHYAFEGRCFVLAAGSIQRASDLPPELETPEATPEFLLRGGSAVYAPDFSIVVEPQLDDEAIVYAELDLELRDRELLTMDVGGHYSREDVLRLRVRRHRAGHGGDRHRQRRKPEAD